MKLSILQFVIPGILVAVSLWNIWAFTLTVLNLPPRDANTVVVCEERWQPIGTDSSAFTRAGRPRIRNDVVIPLNPIPNTIDTPSVIGDFTFNEPVPELPEGVVKRVALLMALFGHGSVTGEEVWRNLPTH